LSRACLGKMIVFMYKWLKQTVFSPQPGSGQGRASLARCGLRARICAGGSPRVLRSALRAGSAAPSRAALASWRPSTGTGLCCSRAQRCRKHASFVEFSYVCPKPVLVNSSCFLNAMAVKKAFFTPMKLSIRPAFDQQPILRPAAMVPAVRVLPCLDELPRKVGQKWIRLPHRVSSSSSSAAVRVGRLLPRGDRAVDRAAEKTQKKAVISQPFQRVCSEPVLAN
jgi:hypothetical protein